MGKLKICLLSLGSNLPYSDMEPIGVLNAAIAELGKAGFQSIKVSGFYETEPVPKSDQPNFINCMVKGATKHDALETLHICQAVERSFDRERHVRWGARTLDIDIISFDQQVYPSTEEWRVVAAGVGAEATVPELVLPHPSMHKRAFVLRPLCDLAPDWLHPVYGRIAADLLAEQSVADQAGVVRI